MEITLSKGFEVLDPQKMMDVDGGIAVPAVAVIVVVVGWAILSYKNQ